MQFNNKKKKSITALPGDTVWADSTIRTDDYDICGEIEVGDGKVWVEGDNHTVDSVDSRSFGSVPMGLVQAIVFRKVVNPFKTFKSEDQSSSSSIG